MIAWFVGTRIGRGIAFGVAFVALLAVAYWRIFTSGKKAERADAAVRSLERTQQANAARAKAEQPISQQEEANDPYNRDAR